MVTISVSLSLMMMVIMSLAVWWGVYNTRKRYIKAELKVIGFKFASRASPNVDGRRVEDRMIETYGLAIAAYRFFALFSKTGECLYRSALCPEGVDLTKYPAGSKLRSKVWKFFSSPPPPSPSEKPKRVHKKQLDIFKPKFYSAKLAGKRCYLGVFANRDVVMICGTDLAEFEEDDTHLLRSVLIVFPGACLMVFASAWWMARKALQPIEILGKGMGDVSIRNLSQRMDPAGMDVEFSEIIGIYNVMLERLQCSFTQAARFCADASHELKTPMTIMQAMLERALMKNGNGGGAQEVFSKLLEQTGRQVSIIESLLLLSRADAGKLEVSVSRFNLSHELELWLEDADLLGEGRGIKVVGKIAPDIEIEGDIVMLQQVAYNLFTNAVRYNREGGEVVCCLIRDGKNVKWTVANTGERIREEDREMIFERFERNRTSKDVVIGVGLGLSLVKEIVIAHGGKIVVSETDAGMTLFEVSLPLV